MTNKTITIIARRWFQKTFGNTYHAVKVYVGGELVGMTTFEYGYGDHYLQTAHKILQQGGFYITTGKMLGSGVSEDYYNFQQDMRNHRDKFIIDHCDVSRKKDLLF